MYPFICIFVKILFMKIQEDPLLNVVVFPALGASFVVPSVVMHMMTKW